MIQLKHQKPDLENRRDASIIAHNARNFITTHEAVEPLFFEGLSTDTSRKVLERLCKRGFLIRYSLFRKNHYYYRLGQHSVRRWGYPRSRSSKLGGLRLPYELGALAYNCLDFDEHPRKRLLPEELKAHLPWFPDTLMQWAYLWDSGRLGTIRVEHRLRPDRVIAKLNEQLYRYSELFEFRALIESARFFFIVVTATEHQAHALQHEAREQALPVELRTSYYPELIRFIY